ncbi:hypothetical protein HNY73_012019 [Argiope bruennichi]|uniref:Uncharacterized protein n=1 Tax=Argiope bruennichi TaxID=94029 RepID=A0A8T0EZ81_ARGBR|nr:hypothetical protein HNY73_012019 [Argiope bruennichi]
MVKKALDDSGHIQSRWRVLGLEKRDTKDETPTALEIDPSVSWVVIGICCIKKPISIFDWKAGWCSWVSLQKRKEAIVIHRRKPESFGQQAWKIDFELQPELNCNKANDY